MYHLPRLLVHQTINITVILVFGGTQFVGSKFGIFGGFWWVRSSILVDKPELGRVLKFGLSGFGPWLGLFLAEEV